MKKLLTLLLALALLIPPTAAHAKETDGYIVQFGAGTAMMLSASDGVVMLGGGFASVENADILQELLDTGCVVHWEPDGMVELLSTNDPYYSDPSDRDYQWGLDAVNAEAAWMVGADLGSVTIAVVDSGIIAVHEDMDGVLTGLDFTASVYSENTRDNTGHGTTVSGILAAETDNGLGIAGLADGVQILPLKCFSSGSTTSLSYVIAAINYAVEAGVDVLNLSLGSETYSYALETAVLAAIDAGVIVVAAAGNDADTLMYPAAFDGVVGVGAVDSDLAASDFSAKNESLFICAPGDAITSLSNKGCSLYSVGNTGSSFAAAFVSAAAAYCKAFDRNMDSADFMALLEETAVDLGTPGYDSEYGFGLLDLGAVATALAGRAIPTADIRISTDRAEVYFEETGDYLSGEAAQTLIAMNAEKDVLLRGEAFEVTIPAGLLSADSRLMDFVPDTAELTPASVAMCTVRGEKPHAVVYSTVGEGKICYIACCDGAYCVQADTTIYSDVLGHWGERGIVFASAHELFNGVGAGCFGPDAIMTRGMLVTVLCRLAGNPGTGSTQFTDVSDDAWYASSVAWAAGNSVTEGYDDGTFRPDKAVTRAEAVTMLARFESYMGRALSADTESGLDTFPDASMVPGWARNAMEWALSEALVGGRTDGTLDPAGTATRAELAAIFMRYINKVVLG